MDKIVQSRIVNTEHGCQQRQHALEYPILNDIQDLSRLSRRQRKILARVAHARFARLGRNPVHGHNLDGTDKRSPYNSESMRVSQQSLTRLGNQATRMPVEANGVNTAAECTGRDTYSAMGALGLGSAAPRSTVKKLRDGTIEIKGRTYRRGDDGIYSAA